MINLVTKYNYKSLFISLGQRGALCQLNHLWIDNFPFYNMIIIMKDKARLLKVMADNNTGLCETFCWTQRSNKDHNLLSK